MILAGDVGGTKVHLALYNFEGGRLKPVRDEKVAPQEFATLDALVNKFLRPGEREQIVAACFGCPGPVRNIVDSVFLQRRGARLHSRFHRDAQDRAAAVSHYRGEGLRRTRRYQGASREKWVDAVSTDAAYGRWAYALARYPQTHCHGLIFRRSFQVHDSFRRVIARALRDAGAQEPDRLALALFAMIVGYATFYWSKPLDTTERTSVLEAAYAMVERAVRKGKGIVRTVPKTKRADTQMEDN